MINADAIRTNVITTVHKVTADIVNGYAAHRDQRKRDDAWHFAPIIKAGTRLILRRDYTHNDERNMRNGVEYCVCALVAERRQYSNAVRWYEYRALGETVCDVKVHGDKPEDTQYESPAERKRTFALRELTHALMRTLSEPIRDFDSLSVTGSIDHEEVLRRLYLIGAVTLDQIAMIQNDLNESAE